MNTLTWAWMNRGGLAGDRLDDVGMAVPGAVDGDAGGEVEVLVTVDGRDPAAAPAGDLEVGDLEPHVGEMGHVANPD